MKKNILFSAIIAIFLLQAAMGFAETIYEGWIFPDQTISVNEKTFYLQVTKDIDYVVLRNNDISVVVGLNQCESEGVLKVCYSDKTYDSNAKQSKVNVKISEELPSISLLRSAQKTTLRQGEKTNISVRIRNSGTISAENVYFEDDYRGFNVSSAIGCDIMDSVVFWKGRLKVNETKICNFYISANDLVEKTTKAKLEYFDNQKRTVYSGPISFKTLPIFNLNVYLQNSEVYLGNLTEIIFNITAINKSYLDSFEIELPNSLLLNFSSGEKITKIENSGNIYSWNGTIENSTAIKIYAQGIYTGYGEIKTNLRYLYHGNSHSFFDRKVINIKNNDAIISTNLNKDEVVDSGSVKWIKIYVENPNKFMDIKNVRIAVESPIFNSSPFTFNEINRTTKQLVNYLKKTFPLVNSSTTYPFNLNLTYQSPYGETFSERLENTIKIEPISSLKIAKEFSKQDPEAEETITITTKITNERHKNIYNVRVYDDSVPYAPYSGPASATINLNASETVTAYSYKLKTPYVNFKKEINITTHTSYSEDDGSFEYSKTFPITVSKKQLELAVTRSFPEILKGTIFPVSYELENRESEELANIRIVPRTQYEFDIVDNGYSVRKLSPGEKIKFTIDSKAKENKSVNYLGDVLLFEDSHNTMYEQNLSGSSVEVKYSSVNSPIIYIERSINDTEQNKPVEVSIKVKNKGTQTQAQISDDSRDWIIYLPQNSERTISYQKTFSSNGTFVLPGVMARYHFSGENISSFSARSTVVVKNAPKIAEKAKEIKTETTPKTPIGVNEPQQRTSTNDLLPKINQTSEPANPENNEGTKKENTAVEKKTGLLDKIANLFNFLFGGK